MISFLFNFYFRYSIIKFHTPALGRASQGAIDSAARIILIAKRLMFKKLAHAYQVEAIESYM